MKIKFKWPPPIFSGSGWHSAALGCCPYFPPWHWAPGLGSRTLWPYSLLTSGIPSPKPIKSFLLSKFFHAFGGVNTCVVQETKHAVPFSSCFLCAIFSQLDWDFPGASPVFCVSPLSYPLCPLCRISCSVNTYCQLINWYVLFNWCLPFPRCVEEESHSGSGPDWSHNSW